MNALLLRRHKKSPELQSLFTLVWKSEQFYFKFQGQASSFKVFNLMGTPRDFENGDYEYYKENQGITKSYYLIIFISSLLISIIGGSMLGWWLHKYHPTNRQLWMVPFGLILLLTPVLVWLSLIISDLRSSFLCVNQVILFT